MDIELDYLQVQANRHSLAAASTNARGVFAGGSDNTDDMEFITIASTGDVTAFGDLTAGMKRNAGSCDSHGGLQG